MTAEERRQLAIALSAARGAAALANQLSRRVSSSSPAAAIASIQVAAATVEASAAQQDFGALNDGLVELERSTATTFWDLVFWRICSPTNIRDASTAMVPTTWLK